MDWSILQFLAAPIAAALIIAGIHAYLGLHVVERGVIFVDLSLAQIASLGAAIAVWQGSDPHSATVSWMSLGFTLTPPRPIPPDFAADRRNLVPVPSAHSTTLTQLPRRQG